jgi:uncharacterized protein YybS (DUF2232 family)
MPVLNKGRGVLLYRDIITGTFISSLFFLSASFIPLVGSVFIVFAPLPVLYYCIKTGRMGGMAVFCLSVLLVYLSLGMFNAEWHLLIFIALGITGVTLAEMFRSGGSIDKTILFPVTVLLALFLAFLGYESYHTGQMPWHLVETYIMKAIQDNVRFYESQGFSPEMINLIKNDMPRITKFFVGIFPSFFYIMASFTVVINTLAGRALLQIKQLPYPEFGDLTTWKAPEKLVWILIISGGSLLVPMNVVKVAGMNLLLICLFIYVFQGFAIVAYVFKRKNVPWFLRFTFYFLIFMQQYLILIISIFGLFDLWVDFRKYVKMKDTTA